MSNRLGQQLGHYLLISVLGTGRLASVYLGKHTSLKTLAAIKVLHVPPSDDHLREIREQALIAVPFTHPNILRTYEFNIEEDIPFIVMDYAPHGSLRDIHPKKSSLPLVSILMYIRQIAGALQYLHDRNLIHLDVKPENVLLGRNYEVLLSDFGLTMVTPNIEVQGKNKIAGTPAYMAPEQFQGNPCPASDQYALGVMVYEWLCGVRPFGGTVDEIENQHLSVSPPLLQGKIQSISPYVEVTVLTALAKDPRDRFASAQAFANALEQANQLETARISIIERSQSESKLSVQYSWNQTVPVPLPEKTVVASSWGKAPSAESIGSQASNGANGLLTDDDITLQKDVVYGEQSPVQPPKITSPGTPSEQNPWVTQAAQQQSQQAGWSAQDSNNPWKQQPLTNAAPNEKDAVKSIASLPPRHVEELGEQSTDLNTTSHLTLFAIANLMLEEYNKAFINVAYTLRAGITQNKPEDNSDGPLNVQIDNSTTHLTFDLLLHESENIDLITGWHKKLYYVPKNKDLQFVDFTFLVTDPGPSSILVDFYHERCWLRTIKLEFEGAEKSENVLERVEVYNAIATDSGSTPC